jgi:hypothetical protein
MTNLSARVWAAVKERGPRPADTIQTFLFTSSLIICMVFLLAVLVLDTR